MPSRSRTRVPSYRLHKASGQAVVTLADKDFYLGKHDTEASKVRYQRVIAEYMAGGAQIAHNHRQERVPPPKQRTGARPGAARPPQARLGV